MKNKIYAAFVLTLMVVGGLLALYCVPVLEIDGTKLRRVDLLSDLRPTETDDELSVDSDSIVLPKPVKPAFVDSCKAGVTCIENYADSASHAMGRFYEALENYRTLGRPVRIAYFGDSFIEGDILTADLRALLQKRFGGSGVGYVNITSVVAGFRTSVHHTFSGWDSHAVTDKGVFDRSKQDLSNHYFVPQSGASVTLEGTSHVPCADSCGISSFYFYSPDSICLSARINRGERREFSLAGDSSAVRVVSVHGDIHSVRWTVDSAAVSARCFGASMDAASGVVLDNFSLRGSGGQQLLGVPMATLRAYNRMRTYDLIVLQYGLNVASPQVHDYSYYTRSMTQVIAHLKAAFPNASILIVGVGDREQRSEETGELQTMPGLKNLIRFQQALAAETHVAFWNLFQAMGGEGSMASMAENKPSLANYDYTHINARGGKRIAGLLFESLMYGLEQYEKREAYEAE